LSVIDESPRLDQARRTTNPRTRQPNAVDRKRISIKLCVSRSIRITVTVEHSRLPMPDPENGSRLGGFTTLLAAHPDAVVAAIADDGVLIPLPDEFPPGEHPALAVPPERATLLEVVVPADRLEVVTAWERVRNGGIAVATVHALSEPATRLTLTMIDARDAYGAFLAALTRDEDELGSGAEALVGPLVVPTRPRQATMHKSMTAVITDIDDNVTRMFGWAREQLVGSRSSEFIHPDDQERAVSIWMQLLSTRDSQRARFRHRCADGGWLWIEVENIHNGAEDPDDVDVITHISDISDEMAAHEALHRREQLFSRLAEALPTGVLQLQRDGSAIYANARLTEILHVGSVATADDLYAAISPTDRPVVTAAVERALAERIDAELEAEIGSVRGQSSRRCSLTIVAVPDHEGRPGALVCLDDITESAQLREELRRQATHDVLTGLPNHRALVAAIDHELERSRRTARMFAVLFLDLDHFKALNDTLGHGAGDNALHETGQVIRASVRAIDTVGRWGGEEFVVLLPETDGPAAMKAAERVRSAVAQHRYTSVEGAYLTCSIGVAARPDDGSDRDTLLASADRAMYIAKQLGRNQVIAARDQAAAALAADATGSGNEQNALLVTVEALAAVVESRDHYTASHSADVAMIAQRVALRLACDARELHLIGLAARLHDIGKIAVPDAILNKPGSLTEGEWQLIHAHPAIGADIVSRIPALRATAPLIRSHHERYDGSGYPDRVAKDVIPLGARIICAADAYSAMITDRPYRRSRLPAEAVQELRRCAGSQFDPAVVESLAQVIAEDHGEQHAA
jgi:diguanylate cyclase (GGDEF)-like protein/PAS domain S-box-containing protein